MSFPAFIAPQLLTLAYAAPDGDGWIHEIKHDGYRTMLVLDRGIARAFTRNGYDWTDKYKPIATACEALCHSAILDGEVVVEDERGASDFASLTRAIAREPHRLVFHAFDLLWLNGVDLRNRPLVERRAELAKLLIDPPRACLRYSEHVEGDGPDFFRVAVKHGLEGIVSKRADSRYRSGRSKTWLKIKNMIESELMLLGAEIDRDGKPLAHLAWNGAEYAGVAFFALSTSDRQKLIDRLQLASAASPLAPRRPAAQWIRPCRVRVRHLQTTGSLRHATVRGFAER